MESKSSVQYSVVIPVYNTVQVLRELQQRINQVFTNHVMQAYEIILVDDDSPNAATWPAIEDLVRNDPNISAIRLTRNFGQHAAILCGLAHAKGTYIITMDDDLQHAPEDIPSLINLKDHDVVIGQFLQKKHSRIRNISSILKGYFDRVLSGKPRNLSITTFCLIQQVIAKQMLDIANNPYPLLSSLIFYVTKDVVGVPVSHSSRREGTSGYSPIKLIRLFSRLLINNFDQVFRFVTGVGALLFIISSVLLFILLAWNFFKQDVSGLLFLGFFILLCHGFLLLALGFLGTSISRISAVVEQKKPYLIRQRIF